MSPYLLSEVQAYNRLMADSFYVFTGNEIVPGASQFDDAQLAEAMFSSPSAIVSHGIEADPVFRYANGQALVLWEMTWADFTRLPSRLSAESGGDIQSDRNRLLKTALENGYVDTYSGIRVSSAGRRFEIRDTVLWNVVAPNGVRHGQAAFIRNWRYL